MLENQSLKNNILTIEINIQYDEHCLYHNPKTQDYSLNYKINMDYADKPPQLGVPIVFLSNINNPNVGKELKKKLDIFEGEIRMKFKEVNTIRNAMDKRVKEFLEGLKKDAYYSGLQMGLVLCKNAVAEFLEKETKNECI